MNNNQELKLSHHILHFSQQFHSHYVGFTVPDHILTFSHCQFAFFQREILLFQTCLIFPIRIMAYTFDLV